MKAYRKASMYEKAYEDAKLVWNQMTEQERAKNFTFKQQ